jgi:hypothetical protein
MTSTRADLRVDPRGDLTVRTIAMPADTNANGDIFGGWVMSRMDQAGGIAGVRRARGRVVTVKVQTMTFPSPGAGGRCAVGLYPGRANRPHIDGYRGGGLGAAVSLRRGGEGHGWGLHLRLHHRRGQT